MIRGWCAREDRAPFGSHEFHDRCLESNCRCRCHDQRPQQPGKVTNIRKT
jgi:hypothetical protein